MIFKDRQQAASLLADRLSKYKNANGVVLSIPRGGVPLGYVIAKELGLPLDIILAKKIGHPMNSEYAVGSVTIDDYTIDKHSDISQEYYYSEVKRIQEELKEKSHLFRKNRSEITLAGKIVIITDDGIATGNTLAACIQNIRKKNPEKIIVAVPVSPPTTAFRFRKQVDEFICLHEPNDFRGVGQFYSNFSQISDDEVIRLLNKK